MFLNALLGSGQILTQPVVAEPNTGIRVGLSLGFTDQRFERLKLMDNSCQRRAFTIGISEGELSW